MNEFELIKHVLQGVPKQADGLLCGVGDDCAVLAAGTARDWLISTDQFLEDVHFKPEWASWSQIGRKAVLAALSDIAAMGGRPRFLVIGLAVPAEFPLDAISECYAAMRAVALEADAFPIGGDTTRSKAGLQLHVTVVGDIRHGHAIYRRGARVGDPIYVTGQLGGSAAGLNLLQQNDAKPHEQAMIDRHLNPPLRAQTGQWLQSTSCVSSMIDISDGLLADLQHIATASQVRMQVQSVRVPILAGVVDAAQARGGHPTALAVASGEEYELAFTVAQARAGAFRQLIAGAERSLGHGFAQIGEVVSGQGVELVEPSGQHMSVRNHGFVHRFGVQS